MNLSKIIVTITGLGYFVVSLDQFYKGNIAMGVTYFAYALSNIGLYLSLY